MRRVLACVAALLTLVAPRDTTPLRRIPLHPISRSRASHGQARTLEAVSGGSNSIVPITNFADVQYVGAIEVGSANTSILVVFDTGSSDLWVQTQSCETSAGAGCCAPGGGGGGAGARAQAQAAGAAPQQCGLDAGGDGDLTSSNCTNAEVATCMDLPPDQPPQLPAACFCCTYGSGTVAGDVGNTRVQLLDFVVPSAELGLVRETNANFASFQSDGIVGMAFPALATLPSQSTFFGSLLRAYPDTAPVFSFYLSPAPDAEPQSELIIGGYDLGLAAPGARWV